MRSWILSSIALIFSVFTPWANLALAQSCGEQVEVPVYAGDDQLRLAVDIADELRATCPELIVNVLPSETLVGSENGTRIVLGPDGNYLVCVSESCFSDPLSPHVTLPVRAVEAFRSMVRGQTPVHSGANVSPPPHTPQTPRAELEDVTFAETATPQTPHTGTPIAPTQNPWRVEVALTGGAGLWLSASDVPTASNLQLTSELRVLHDDVGGFGRFRIVSPWLSSFGTNRLGYDVNVSSWSAAGEFGLFLRPAEHWGLSLGLAIDASAIIVDTPGISTAPRWTMSLLGVTSLSFSPIEPLELRLDIRSGGYLAPPVIQTASDQIAFGTFRLDAALMVGVVFD